ncbi:MAG: RNA polymerase sigma factor, partial [Candidatus Methylomirabilales bacterium]
MLRYQAGDDSAFEEIVVLYQQTVFNLLYRFAGTREGIEDLAQEIFLRVVRAKRSYQPSAKFSTFLYRVVFNLCVNETRARRKMRMSSLDAEDPQWDGRRRSDPVDPRAESPSDPMEKRELAAHLREALEGLPETQRMALVMNKYHDLSYREIADAIGSTEKAVKSLLARARRN